DRESIWRLSFSHIEYEIMSKISNEIKQGYKIAKAFRLDSLSCTLFLPIMSIVLVADDYKQDIWPEFERGDCLMFNDENKLECSDDDSAGVEFGATHAIQSYHLKNIFLAYIDKLFLK
ncbi:unnamed protein product, partial [Didymodactylos carnosus]